MLNASILFIFVALNNLTLQITTKMAAVTKKCVQAVENTS